MPTRRKTLHYGCVWEDADVLCRALQPVAERQRLLSICSAGDNALALLTLDPSEVVAVDTDHKQLAALDLRARAFEALEYNEMLVFLGVLGGERPRVYQQLRPFLAEPSRRFWDGEPEKVRMGIIHGGTFERYMRWFRTVLPPRTRASLSRLAEASTITAREEIYDKECDSALWRVITSLAFYPRAISMFDCRRRYLEKKDVSVVRVMRERLRRALSVAPWTSNPYLTYFLTGNYSSSALPLYLRPENFTSIRSRITQLSFHHIDVALAVMLGRFKGFNLSNVFDYLSPREAAKTYRSVLAAGEDGARLVYWSTFANSVLSCDSAAMKPLTVEGRLYEQDAVGSYEALHVAEIYSGGECGPAMTVPHDRY
jgi:S-adenosylmethionine-diacylglycerol 3-amino-3-carboxypropyl transferase